MNFLERLTESAALVLDGGMGSALIARGLKLGMAPEQWILERGEAILEVHRAYVVAGSEAIHTNTFGASPVRLATYGLADRCDEINRAAVTLARAADPRFVIGDVGPTGEYLPPVGQGGIEAWRAAFEQQGRALAAAGVDAFHVETMSDLREARVALQALRSVAPELPVMVSMTFERKKRGFFSVMGDPLVAALSSLASEGASAVGANCSVASGDMAALMTEAIAAIAIPLVAQPNAGTPEQAPDGTFRYAQSPEEFAADMAALARLGVRAVGGCCGTDDRFIAALRAQLANDAEARS
ncbi:MAG: homocysteine S-methyltransferase family protein [Thermoanaerobaculia bacterium]|nr:homocysteine S-methyltransferase family protein [Thermoanaerobaculia bacterium]